MIATDTLILFFITTLVVVLSPGPAAIAVTAEAAANGYRRSTWTISGIAIANVAYFVLSATGIAALIIASHTLFSIIKWIGVSYLIYLGLTAIFSKSGALTITPSQHKHGSQHKAFLKGFILEISNPKALLYFSALLPQFIDASNPIGPQILVLCLITLFLDLSCYSIYGLLGAKTAQRGIQPQFVKIINRSAGCVLIFAGLRMATVYK